MTPWRPNAAQLEAAWNATVPDLIRPGLLVLFSGINPSLYSAAVGHHFARPGNRFWPAIAAGGFTARKLSPFEETELLDAGCGITNVVDRATAEASDLERWEYAEGGRRLSAKVATYRPRFIAFLGIMAYRAAFDRPKAVIGPQEGESIGGAKVWVLPNPSGLNAHFKVADLGRLFGELRAAAVEAGPGV